MSFFSFSIKSSKLGRAWYALGRVFYGVEPLYLMELNKLHDLKTMILIRK